MLSSVEDVLDILQDPKLFLGIISNSITMYLVCAKSRKELNEYRKLLILFLISDFIFTTVQEVLKPIAIVDGNLFLIYLSGAEQSQMYLSLYCGLLSITFSIFAFHFMFRAYSISSDSLAPIILSLRKLIVILLIFTCEFFTFSYVCYTYLAYEPSYYNSLSLHFASQNRTLPHNIETAFLIFKSYTEAGKLRLDKLCGILILFSIIAVAAIVITISSIHIVKTLHYTKTMSDNMKVMHRQLFIALLVQLSIPCSLLYLPCSFYFVAPFLFPNTVHTPPWLITTLYSWYPIIDPLTVIFMIADYRRVVLVWMRKVLLLPQETESTDASSTPDVRMNQVSPQ